MKFLLCGCFHGRIPNKLISIAKKEKVDYILSTGDFNNADKLRKIIFKNWKSKKSLEEILGKKKFNRLFKEYISSGKKVLKKINSLNLPIITCYGNNDESSKSPQHRDKKKNKKDYIETLVKNLKNIEFLDFRYKKIGDYFIYFMGG
ncbi:MAG: metallophosphoesterase [Nanoarchaeota archaeon]